MSVKIGFGQYNVTPPLGVAMAGYDKREGVADDLHDPLWARAMVFDDGGTAVSLVVADIIDISRDQYDRVGRLVARWTGIPRSRVIAAGTHTHSSATPAQKRHRRRAGVSNAAFGQLLPDLMASAVRLAWLDRRPAALAATAVQTREQTINRREPGGGTDEELTVVHMKRRGAADGVLLNYACHGVVMGPDSLALSADWIGQTRAVLEAKQPGLFSLLAVAPSGDINPLPRSIRKEIQKRGVEYFTNDPFSGIYDRTGGTFTEVAAMGRTVAAAALRALPRCVAVDTRAGVAAVTRSADIGAGRKKLRVPFRLFRLGDLVVVGMSGEQFVQTGARVKAAVREHGLTPVVVTHAPHLAYVPTPDAFTEDREHDYEVDTARRMGMAPDAAERELKAIRQGLGVLTQ